MSDEKISNDPQTCASIAAQLSMRSVLELPFSGSVARDLPCYQPGQFMDVYYPADTGKLFPAVILITGYPDPGFEKMTGMKLKDVGQNQSWGRLLAASGVATILYTAADPVQDALDLVDWICANGKGLRIDVERLGVLSVSGNVPNALHVLQKRPVFRCATLCYGFMLDTETDKGVSAAATQFRFANPNSIELELAAGLGLLVVRAGKDAFTGLNNSIDSFVANSLRCNRDLELINYAQGEHAFDMKDASLQSHQLIRRILEFNKQRLIGQSYCAVGATSREKASTCARKSGAY